MPTTQTPDPKRLATYRAVLAETCIDPNDTSYSGGEDAGEFVRGERPIERYCAVTIGGGFSYATPTSTTLAQAKAKAAENIVDDIFNEIPHFIIDLDTGRRWQPNWTRIPWRAAATPQLKS